MVEATTKHLSVHSDTSSLKLVRDFVRKTLEGAPLTERDRRLVILGIDEAVTNVISYRSAHPTSADIGVRIEYDDVRIRVLIEDHGVDLDPGPSDFSELEKALREEETRCIGIFLIRQVMDEVTYRFKRGFQNDLELIRFTR
ncbi:MAG: ATP-binding protein [Planctomycetota bacterium]|nr:ATP-binding protein [Planctomycetota bacterium]